MTINNNIPQPLRITENQGDTIEIFIDPEVHPETYKRKKWELINQSGMTEQEAEEFIRDTPFVLELYYSINQGLFIVESEAAACGEIYNPYTGMEIQNNNLPPKTPPTPRQTIDRLTGEMENMRDDIYNASVVGDFTKKEQYWIENTLSHIDDALAEFHKLTDPEEDLNDEEDFDDNDE